MIYLCKAINKQIYIRIFIYSFSYKLIYLVVITIVNNLISLEVLPTIILCLSMAVNLLEIPLYSSGITENTVTVAGKRLGKKKKKIEEERKNLDQKYTKGKKRF